jgi:hypothetical protein
MQQKIIVAGHFSKLVLTFGLYPVIFARNSDCKKPEGKTVYIREVDSGEAVSG